MTSYFVTIKQRGDRITGLMQETQKTSKSLKRSNHNWKGKVIGDYLIFNCKCNEPDRFLISSAMFYIHPGGGKLSGFYISNGGASAPVRTWVSYTELFRKE